MSTERFRSLSARDRALVAVAVLFDGREAGSMLENDKFAGENLKLACDDLASEAPELRMPFVGTLLRSALKEILD